MVFLPNHVWMSVDDRIKLGDKYGCLCYRDGSFFAVYHHRM